MLPRLAGWHDGSLLPHFARRGLFDLLLRFTRGDDDNLLPRFHQPSPPANALWVRITDTGPAPPAAAAA